MAHQISAHGVTGAHELTITLTLHRLWLSTLPQERQCSLLPVPLSVVFTTVQFCPVNSVCLSVVSGFPVILRKVISTLRCFIMALL